MTNPSLDDFFRSVQKNADCDNDVPPDDVLPIDRWDPPLLGDIDIRITRKGVWYHEGGEIKRHALVTLFSSILKREGDDYFLVSPVEKWRIAVDDVPFYITELHVEHNNGRQNLVFKTSTNDVLIADETHPIKVQVDPESGEPSPYIRVRSGMDGLMSRAVFYELAAMGEVQGASSGDLIGVRSAGCFFPLE